MYKKRKAKQVPDFDLDEHTYQEGPIRKYSIITDSILKCLKIHGNTVIGQKHFEQSIKLIWLDTFGNTFPKKNYDSNEKFKSEFDTCRQKLCNYISDACGFKVNVRKAGPFKYQGEILATSKIKAGGSCWIVERAWNKVK
jgi:hypothetical protein